MPARPPSARRGGCARRRCRRQCCRAPAPAWRPCWAVPWKAAGRKWALRPSCSPVPHCGLTQKTLSLLKAHALLRQGAGRASLAPTAHRALDAPFAAAGRQAHFSEHKKNALQESPLVPAPAGPGWLTSPQTGVLSFWGALAPRSSHCNIRKYLCQHPFKKAFCGKKPPSLRRSQAGGQSKAGPGEKLLPRPCFKGRRQRGNPLPRCRRPSPARRAADAARLAGLCPPQSRGPSPGSLRHPWGRAGRVQTTVRHPATVPPPEPPPAGGWRRPAPSAA